MNISKELIKLAEKIETSTKIAGTNKRQLSKDFKTKNGVEFRKGEDIMLSWEVNKWNIAYINASGDRKCAIKTESLPKYISTIKEPSMKALEKMVGDGIAKSILGNKVEPDGWDQYDAPSWLLAIGLI